MVGLDGPMKTPRKAGLYGTKMGTGRHKIRMATMGRLRDGDLEYV
jgi:hypothetical protein